MWMVVGYDDDGERHVWNYCETEEEAKRKMADVLPVYSEMVDVYREDIDRAIMLPDNDPNKINLTYWKMQGFLVERFCVEEAE